MIGSCNTISTYFIKHTAPRLEDVLNVMVQSKVGDWGFLIVLGVLRREQGHSKIYFDELRPQSVRVCVCGREGNRSICI